MLIISQNEQIQVKLVNVIQEKGRLKQQNKGQLILHFFIFNSFNYNIFKIRISSTGIMHFDQILSPFTPPLPLVLVFHFTITCSFIWLLLMTNPQRTLSPAYKYICAPVSDCTGACRVSQEPQLEDNFHSNFTQTKTNTFFPIRFFILLHHLLHQEYIPPTFRICTRS